MSLKIHELMTEMPCTIGFDISINKAKEIMETYSCHHLPVLEGGKLIGILSDRDLTMAQKLSGKDTVLVSELMTEDPFVVDREMNISEVVQAMLQQNIHSVIVSGKEGHPWGIFTSTDALKYVGKQS